MLSILADSITADMGLIPGLAFVGPAFGIPLSVLASFVERPFYSRGGVTTHAIWYSLQANCVSLIAGIPLLILFAVVAAGLGFGASDAAFFLVWPLIAVCASSIIERIYIVRRNGVPRLSWPWAVAANVVSAGSCFAILFPVVWLRASQPSWIQILRPWETPLQLFACLAGSALFAFSFYATRRSAPGEGIVTA
ncbi:MAG TPA: hypothetical protein VMD30_10410 [Tepidisphaeraceae bacterium]|nr:hypothetical protein [Tepidisphaeraceae bacterium]